MSDDSLGGQEGMGTEAKTGTRTISWQQTDQNRRSRSSSSSILEEGTRKGWEMSSKDRRGSDREVERHCIIISRLRNDNDTHDQARNEPEQKLIIHETMKFWENWSSSVFPTLLFSARPLFGFVVSLSLLRGLEILGFGRGKWIRNRGSQEGLNVGLLRPLQTSELGGRRSRQWEEDEKGDRYREIMRDKFRGNVWKHARLRSEVESLSTASLIHRLWSWICLVWLLCLFLVLARHWLPHPSNNGGFSPLWDDFLGSDDRCLLMSYVII